MKCPKCGNEYPNKIYTHHLKRCNVEEEGIITFINPYGDMSFNEMRAEAKKRGLDGGKNPTKASLELLLVGDDC